MSNRLDQEREAKLQPKRINTAVEKITALGYSIISKDNNKIQFEHKGGIVTFFPYSGWASGKTINDGRGLNKLLNQLK